MNATTMLGPRSASADVNQKFLWAQGGAYEGSTAITYAARFGSADAVRLLIARGADVNAVMKVKDTQGRPSGDRRPLDWSDTAEVRGILQRAGAQATPDA